MLENIFSHIVGHWIMGRTLNTFAMKHPKIVPIEYPNVPVNIAGWTADFHPFAAAIALAVAGPPTFAFAATKIAQVGYPNRPFPSANENPSWVRRRIRMNRNTGPPMLTATLISAHAPRVAKNTSINAALSVEEPEKIFEGAKGFLKLLDCIYFDLAVEVISTKSGAMILANPRFKLG
mmetsp:Transcript_2978/g.4075  ORF Transcript_2978/g.4075 Transcript_2978/m.4075 type:complete len:178 (+) Transcript_2978:194-727(+)